MMPGEVVINVETKTNKNYLRLIKLIAKAPGVSDEDKGKAINVLLPRTVAYKIEGQPWRMMSGYSLAYRTVVAAKK